jgi:hypothetical protein
VTDTWENPFANARLKLKRAKEHIDDLDAMIREFIEGSVYEVSVQRDSKTSNEFVKIGPIKSVPNDFALILGDAIHNIKSALDFAWYALTFVDTPPKERRKIKFPLYPERLQLEMFLKDRKDQQSVFNLSDVLLSVIQPYKGGNGDILIALNILSKIDKHRLLIPQIQIGRIDGLWAEDGNGEKFGIKWRLIPSSRALVLSCGKHRNVKVIKKGQLSATIVFGKGTPMAGHLVVLTLRDFEKAVSGVLKSLAMLGMEVHTPQ